MYKKNPIYIKSRKLSIAIASILIILILGLCYLKNVPIS